MLASGVRRSCDTAASRVVRAALSRASPAASRAARTSRSRPCRIAAWAAYALTTRWSSAAMGGPSSSRCTSSSTVTSSAHVVVSDGTVLPAGRCGSVEATTVDGRSSSRLGEHRGAHTEVVARPVEQRWEGTGLGQQVAAHRREGRRLALGRDRLLGAAGGDVDDRRHRHGDEDEDGERQGVRRVADGQRAPRLGEEPVDDERADDGAQERRPDAADERADHGQREVEQQVEGERVSLLRRHEHSGQRDEGDDGEEQPGDDSTGGQARDARAAAADLRPLVRDEVDVDVAGAVGDLGGDARAQDLLPPTAAAHPDDDLRRVDAAGVVEDRLGDVGARDVLELGAEVARQPAQARQGGRVGGGQTLGRLDVAGDEVATGRPRRDAGAAPEQRLAAGATRERDDDPFPSRPLVADALVGPVALERLVDAVGEPQERDLAQGREVADPEVVRQGGVDLVGSVDVAVRHPATQGLGRHVDDLHLVRPTHDLVGHRLLLPYAGDRLDDVVERLEVLDVDRRDDVDAGLEDLLDVLPALLVSPPDACPAPPPVAGGGAGHVGVGELVDEHDVGTAGQDGVDVELGQGRLPR